MKKIGLFCLCLASLSLAGCFHVPDEDWLPSRNKIKTENVEKDEEVEQAINSFMKGIDIISSDGNELGNEENVEFTENIDVEALGESTDNEEITADEAENEEIEENNSSEGEI